MREGGRSGGGVAGEGRMGREGWERGGGGGGRTCEDTKYRTDVSSAKCGCANAKKPSLQGPVICVVHTVFTWF